MGEIFAQYYNYSDNYDTVDVTSSIDAQLLSTIIFFILIAGIISYIIVALFTGKVFAKAGVESWKAWVPVYNTWTLLQLGGQQGFWAIITLIPVANIAAMVMIYIAMHHIGLKFGKSGTFVLLAIFAPLVWFIWLAMDDSKWRGKKVIPAPTPPDVA